MDSGSAFSIIPHKSAAAPTGPRLITADGTPLKCWGRRTCMVHTRTKKFVWSFLLAPVAFPIIGADFLCSFKLMVDVSNKRLVSHGGQLTQLVLGKHTSAAVVTGVMAAPLQPAVVPSTPSCPTVEALSSTPSPSSHGPRHKQPAGTQERPRSPQGLSRQLHRRW